MIIDHIDKSQAVLDENGDIETFTVKAKGEQFHCRCGANCFHKPDRENLDLYRCNSCHTTYEAKDK